MIDEAVAPFAADPALEMSTLRTPHRRRRRARQSQRDQGRRRRERLRAVFLARADSVHPARAARRRRRGGTSGSTSTAATRCCAWRPAADRRSNAPRRSSSCARSSTASGSSASKPRTTRSASTRPTISSASARCSQHHPARQLRPGARTRMTDTPRDDATAPARTPDPSSTSW